MNSSEPGKPCSRIFGFARTPEIKPQIAVPVTVLGDVLQLQIRHDPVPTPSSRRLPPSPKQIVPRITGRPGRVRYKTGSVIAALARQRLEGQVQLLDIPDAPPAGQSRPGHAAFRQQVSGKMMATMRDRPPPRSHRARGVPVTCLQWTPWRAWPAPLLDPQLHPLPLGHRKPLGHHVLEQRGLADALRFGKRREGQPSNPR